MELDGPQPLGLERDYDVACLPVRRSAGVIELGECGAPVTALSRHSVLSSLGSQYAEILTLKSI